MKDWVQRMNNEELSQVFGQRLRQLRKSRAITIEQLAEHCDISEGHLRNMESGLRVPSVPVLISLCNSLKITPQELLQPFLEIEDIPINKKSLLEKIQQMEEEQLEQLIGILQIILR